MIIASPSSFFIGNEDNWFGFVALSNDKTEVTHTICGTLVEPPVGGCVRPSRNACQQMGNAHYACSVALNDFSSCAARVTVVKMRTIVAVIDALERDIIHNTEGRRTHAYSPTLCFMKGSPLALARLCCYRGWARCGSMN